MSERVISVRVNASLAKRIKLSNGAGAGAALKGLVLEGLYDFEHPAPGSVARYLFPAPRKEKLELELSSPELDFVEEFRSKLAASGQTITVHEAFFQIFERGLEAMGYNADTVNSEDGERVTFRVNEEVAERLYSMAPANDKGVPQISRLVNSLVDLAVKAKSKKAEPKPLLEPAAPAAITSFTLED